MTVIDGEDGVDGEDGECNRRTENEKNIMERTGRTGTDGESTANRLERNSRSELYYKYLKLLTDRKLDLLKFTWKLSGRQFSGIECYAGIIFSGIIFGFRHKYDR